MIRGWLSVYPLVMDEPGEGTRTRVPFNKAERFGYGSKLGTMVGRPIDERTVAALQAGERSVFEVDAETLMRLRLREFDSENTASFVTHENAAHRMGVQFDGEKFLLWFGLQPSSSQSPTIVEDFRARTDSIRSVGRGMLHTDAPTLYAPWNSVAVCATSPTPISLVERLKEDGPLAPSVAAEIADGLLERIETAVHAGMEFDTLSVNHFYVANDLSVHFAPMPHPADGESKSPENALQGILEWLGESDPSAFKGAIQAYPLHRKRDFCIGFGFVERSCPSPRANPPEWWVRLSAHGPLADGFT